MNSMVLRFADLSQVVGPISFVSLPGAVPVSYLSSTPFQRTFIIRGVGYRGSVVTNNTLNFSNIIGYLVLDGSYPFSQALRDRYNADLDRANKNEFPAYRYLVLRLGHSAPSYFPIPNNLRVKITKKDRKLVLSSQNLSLLSIFSRRVYKLRQPSAYTGRGIRFKGQFVRRKLGKKDVRKGRFF